jgi:signal peptide peptidase SppA
MHIQFENCLDQAHLVMGTADFREAVRMDTGDFWLFDPDSYMARLRPYVIKDGILQIPVKGVLLHDFPYAIGGWATGYDYIWKAFERGMGDLNVKGIALIVDSAGGEVAGCVVACDKMFALKGTKPIRGYASESAYSAAYAVISVCDSIAVSSTGGVGSIGVVTGHTDVSGAMDQAGLKFTYVFAGRHKVDGNPYEALPTDVKARIQKRIDSLYAVFVSNVARNRGMEEQAVRDTEALTFTASEALSNGLADSIGSLDDALAQYAADLSSDEGDDTMSIKTEGTVDQAAHDNAVAAARADGIAQGIKDGLVSQRTRITAILALDDAKDRPVAANNVAMNTDMTAEAAATFLAAMPKEVAPVATTAAVSEPAPHTKPGFVAAMDATKNPNIGVDGSETDESAYGDSPDGALAAAHAYGIAGLRAPAKVN